MVEAKVITAGCSAVMEAVDDGKLGHVKFVVPRVEAPGGNSRGWQQERTNDALPFGERKCVRGAQMDELWFERVVKEAQVVEGCSTAPW